MPLIRTYRFRTGLLLFLLSGMIFVLFSGCAGQKEILSEHQPEGSHLVEVVQIGDPGFPFGPVCCEVRLYNNRTLVKKETFEMKNDGKNAGPENFSVLWQSDAAEILVMSEEEEEKTIRLPFE